MIVLVAVVAAAAAAAEAAAVRATFATTPGARIIINVEGTTGNIKQLLKSLPSCDSDVISTCSPRNQ